MVMTRVTWRREPVVYCSQESCDDALNLAKSCALPVLPGLWLRSTPDRAALLGRRGSILVGAAGCSRFAYQHLRGRQQLPP